MSTTRARGIQYLLEKGIKFQPVEYSPHLKRIGGWFETQAIRTVLVRWTVDLEEIRCRLPGDVTPPLWYNKGHQFSFVLIPRHRHISTKKSARFVGTKSVEIADERDSKRLTGYVEDAMSPFGSFTTLPVIMDESLLNHDKVLINVGRSGVFVAMNPWDIQQVLEASVEDVVL